MQSKIFKKIYIQNASLEISKTSVLKKYKTITGKKIIPFFTKNYEGFDINEKQDLVAAKIIIKKNFF
jgi:CMP-N-acetylneuraminic acid synthetase